MATTPTNNPVPSESPRDLKFNAGKVDEFVTSRNLSYVDRFGGLHHTIDGINYLAKDAISKFGYITIDSFQAGAQITLPNQVLRDLSSGEYYRWDGQIPKTVPQNSTPANSGGVGVGKWLSVGDATLRGNLSSYDSGKGDSLISVQQTFTGASKQTAHDKFMQTCHINDFPSTPSETWLKRAVDGTPSGWTLQLGAGPYLANFTSTRNDITIRGIGIAPTPNESRTEIPATGSGTVIQGLLRFTGSNVGLFNFAVDNGEIVTARTGIKGDAFVVSNVGISMRPAGNNHIYGINSLASLTDPTAHSFLIENFTKGSIINCNGYGGFVGPVFKVQNCFIDNIGGYRNSQSGVQLKSNDYGVFARNKIGRLYADDEGLNTSGSVGVFFYAQNAQLQGTSVDSITAKGYGTGVGLTMSAGTVINDISIGNIITEGTNDLGFAAYGGMINVSIGSIVSTRSKSGRSVRINDDVLGINIGSIMASAETNVADSIYLGGVFNVGSVTALLNYIPTQPTGIVVRPSAAATRQWRLGSYSSAIDTNSIAMENGWTGRDSNTPTLRLSGSQACISAYIGVPASRSNAEVWTTVASSMRPATPQTFLCAGFVSGSSAVIPIIGMVNTAGKVYFPYLSNSSQFPANVVAVAINAQWPIN